MKLCSGAPGEWFLLPTWSAVFSSVFFITCRLLGVCFRVLKVIVGRVCRWSLFVVDVGCRGCRVSLPLVVVVGYWLSDVGFRLLVVESLCWLVVVAQIFLMVPSFFYSTYCQKQ